MQSEVASCNIVEEVVEWSDYRRVDNGAQEAGLGAVVCRVQQDSARGCEEAEKNDRDQGDWFSLEVWQKLERWNNDVCWKRDAIEYTEND
jgi:hypothetical protein